jgi:hypothetical protein
MRWRGVLAAEPPLTRVLALARHTSALVDSMFLTVRVSSEAVNVLAFQDGPGRDPPFPRPRRGAQVLRAGPPPRAHDLQAGLQGHGRAWRQWPMARTVNPEDSRFVREDKPSTSGSRVPLPPPPNLLGSQSKLRLIK